jgi:heptaprenyl diphosphate synthase
MRKSIKEIALIGILSSLALIFSYIEKIVGFDFILPGVKLGLSNLVIVVAIYVFSNKTAITVNLIRVIAVGILFGNVFSIIYSIFGAFFSFFAMIIAKKTNIFSVAGVSIAGGIFHNIGQIIAVIIMLKSTAAIAYLPLLLVSGVVTGMVIGILSNIIIIQLKKALVI